MEIAPHVHAIQADLAAAAAPPPVIAMTDVGMTYPNGKTALTEVSVEIPSGDFVFLVRGRFNAPASKAAITESWT